jgi:hypothetical protein
VPPTNRLPSEPDSPVPGQSAGQDASVLWLVSFGDEDDRELLPSQIAAALRQGQIDGATIVWRDGLPDWLPISSVPALAALIPAGGETTTAPVVIANVAPAPAPAPTEDITTAPGLGNDAAADAATRAGATTATQPVAKIALKTSQAPTPAQSPKGVVAEEVATVKAGEAADPGGKPAWRGKTKIGLPKVDVQRPEIARRLEPVKAPAAKVEATAKPSATATPRPVTAGAKSPAAAAVKPPDPAAAKPAEPAAAKPAQEDVEPETARPVPAAVQPAKAEPAPAPKPAVPEHSPEAPTAKLPDVAKKAPEAARTDARKPPVPDRKPPPARSTIAGVGVTIGNLGSQKAAPKPPTRAPEPAAPANRGARDIWNDTEDAEPISVDPSSIRPPTPSPSPNIAKATALSSGTLGLTRKPAPKPPTPKAVSKPPVEDVVEMNPGTPSLQALSAPLSTRTEGERVDDLLHLEAAPAKVGILAAPTFEPPAVAPNVEDLASDLVIETDDAQATTPFGLDAPLDALTRAPEPSAPVNTAPAAAKPKQASTAAATPPKAEEKKRSLVPFYVGGAIVALGISIGVRQLAGPSPPAEPAPRAEQPQAPAPVAESPKLAPEPEPPPAETAAAKEPEPTPAPEPKPAAEPRKPTTAVVGGEPAQKPATKPDPVAKPEPAPKKPVVAAPEKAVDMGGEFDKSAAAAALGAAASASAGCRKEGDPSGLAVVKVTFTNSGKATRAVIEGPPFAGTATGGCIAAQMRAAKVPPFGGDRVTVSKRVVIQ